MDSFKQQNSQVSEKEEVGFESAIQKKGEYSLKYGITSEVKNERKLFFTDDLRQAGLVLATQLDLTIHVLDFQDSENGMEAKSPVHFLIQKGRIDEVKEDKVNYQDKHIIHIALQYKGSIPILFKSQFDPINVYLKKLIDRLKRPEEILIRALSRIEQWQRGRNQSCRGT